MSSYRRGLMMKKIPTVQEGWVDKGLAKIYEYDLYKDGFEGNFILFTIPLEEDADIYKVPKVSDLENYQGIIFESRIKGNFFPGYTIININTLDLNNINLSNMKKIVPPYNYKNNVNDYQGMFSNVSCKNIINMSKIKVNEYSYLFSGKKCIHSIGGVTPTGVDKLELENMNYVLSKIDMSDATDTSYMFFGIKNIDNIDLRTMNPEKIVKYDNMFIGFDNLIKITCKQSFKDWCITNQDAIALPEAMREGGSGTWEIVS